MSLPIKFIVNFIVILCVQLFLLNNIAIKSSVLFLGIPVFTPLFYPLILLILPIRTPHWLLMLLGFITGITVDMFTNTPGMHAAACVLLAYLRPRLLDLFFQQSVKELGDATPSLFRMGISSFLLYISMAILVHHLFFYIIQIWSFKNTHIILFKTIVSGILSVILIVLSQLLFTQRKIYRQ